MLNGDKTDFDGETFIVEAIGRPLENPPPIYLAALRSSMVEMAAEFGDGVIFNLWPEGFAKNDGACRIGAERAGKDPESVEIVNRAMVLCTKDKARGRDMFRAQFAPYYATPVYNNFLSWAGYEDAAATISEGWAEKDRAKTSGAMTDAMIDEIGIIGSKEEIQDRIREDAEGGVHTHIIAPLGGDPEDVHNTLNAFLRSFSSVKAKH